MGNPWSKAHPQLWEFILFNLLSNCATITNFVVMWLCTGWVFKGLADIPFRFFIFDYGEDALGLCGFLSFLTATALAQMVNFFVQKNWVFRSDAAFSRAAPRYILLAVFLVILSAACRPGARSFLQVWESLKHLLLPVPTGLISWLRWRSVILP